MFTGIIKGIGTVKEVRAKNNFSTLIITLPSKLSLDLEIGASISIDGVCLTVTTIDNEDILFDVMGETLRLTTLGELKSNSKVNIERSIKDGTEVGGHIISGHVDTTAEIISIETPENNYVVTFSLPESWRKYIFNKGFISVNGASLTLTNVDRQKGTFSIWLIPETLRMTTFGQKKVGDRVNIEVERNTQVMVDTTISFLEEHLTQLTQNLK